MNKTNVSLMYAGTIPFVLCALCLMTNIMQLPLLGLVEKILSAYGLVILSFLAGSHWGQNINNTTFLSLLSNVIVIAIWLGFLTLGFKMLITMFIATFLTLLIIDNHLFRKGLITYPYFHARCLASAIVIISLMSAGIMS